MKKKVLIFGAAGYIGSILCKFLLHKNFEIIHLHGNNYKSVNEEGLPNVIEITFLKKGKINTLKKKYKYNFPIKNLDFPCDPLNKDIEISFDITNFKS